MFARVRLDNEHQHKAYSYSRSRAMMMRWTSEGLSPIRGIAPLPGARIPRSELKENAEPILDFRQHAT